MKTITKQQYYQLCGLRFLADEKNKELVGLISAVASLTGEQLDESDYGHSSDFVYGEMTVKELLKILDIKVANTK